MLDGRGATDRGRGRAILLTVAALAILLVGLKTAAQLQIGPAWDTYSFLANARDFAGDSIGYAEFDRPPLISAIAAVAFRLGFVDVAVVQLIDALFAVLAVVGLYLLLRERFGMSAGLFGSLALIMSPPVWEWIGVGYTDIAGVSLCIWALLAAWRATEEKPAYYLLALPLAVLAVLMRHTALLFLPPLTLWFVFRANFFRDMKWIASGTGLALLTYAPFAVYYTTRFDDPFYPYVASLAVQVATEVEVTPYAIGRDFEGYVRSADILAAPAALSPLTLVVLALAAVGLAWTAVAFFRRSRPAPWRVGLAFGALVAGVVAFREGGLLVQQLVVLLGVFALWKALGPTTYRPNEPEPDRAWAERALDAVMLAWLLAFLVFHENWAQRFPRYFVTMAPSVIYLAALGASGATKAIRAASRFGIPARAANLALVPFIALVPLGIALDIAGTSFEEDPLVTDVVASAEHVLAEQGDAEGLVVYSDAWPMTSWYLGSEALAMPFFTEPAAFDHELLKADADYFLSLREQQVEAFDLEATYGRMRVLVPGEEPKDLPRVQYLGAGWENYLESLDYWRFYLMHDEGNRNMEGSAYLDAYDLDYLRRFDAVAVYGVRWRDLPRAESVIRSYVEEGGTLLVDASANLDRVGFSFSNISFLDTVMRRELVDPEADFAPQGRFAVEYPEIASLDPGPWLDPEGDAWYGAAYTPLPTSLGHEVLVTLGGKPVVSVMPLGRGRVYWVGQNLFWHAHTAGTADEARLVRILLDEMLER